MFVTNSALPIGLSNRYCARVSEACRSAAAAASTPIRADRKTEQQRCAFSTTPCSWSVTLVQWHGTMTSGTLNHPSLSEARRLYFPFEPLFCIRLNAEPPCEDEARVGQKGRLCHSWWIKRQRPARATATFDGPTSSPLSSPRPAGSSASYCPRCLPGPWRCAWKALFLGRFAATLAPDEHAVMVLDGAEWHGANAFVVPDTITLVPLPPCSRELNLIERVWIFLRERLLSLRVFPYRKAMSRPVARHGSHSPKSRGACRACVFTQRVLTKRSPTSGAKAGMRDGRVL